VEIAKASSLITGEIGCGKTTLYSESLSDLDDERRVAKFFRRSS